MYLYLYLFFSVNFENKKVLFTFIFLHGNLRLLAFSNCLQFNQDRLVVKQTIVCKVEMEQSLRNVYSSINNVNAKVQMKMANNDFASVDAHLKTHCGEKSNKCNQCNKAFSQAGHLRQHFKTHSGEKPNKCNQCDYACSDPSSLS